MGFGGISIWQLLIILVIIVLLFGTKRLRNIGSDLGSAIRGFRNSVKEQDDSSTAEDATFETDATRNVVTNQTVNPQPVQTQTPQNAEVKPNATTASSHNAGQDKP